MRDYKEILESGKPLKVIKALLTIEGLKDKEITRLTAGLARKTAGFTQADTLAFLGEELRTEKELLEKLLEVRAINELRWFGDRNKIRKTINSVAVKYGAVFTEELASEELKARAKSLLAASAKKPEAEEPGLGLELGSSEVAVEEPVKPAKGKK